MGRNKVKPMSVTFPADTLERLLQTCEDTGQSKHGFIVKAVEAALYNNYPNKGGKNESKAR